MEKSISGRAFAHVLPDMILFVGFYLGGNEVDKFVDVIGCDDAFFLQHHLDSCAEVFTGGGWEKRGHYSTYG